MVAAGTLSDLPELTVEQAEGWVAAALAEVRALRQYDEHLFPASNDPDALRIAEQLHAAWRWWADEAASLYERVRPLLNARRHVAGAHDLDYAIGRAYAMLKLSPRDMLARQEQVRRGEVLTAEEVRRDLIVEEVHRTREALLDCFGGELDALVEHSLQRQEAQGRRVIALPPRPPKMGAGATKRTGAGLV